MPLTFIRQFLQLESSSGIILLISALLALIANNSFLSLFYQAFFSPRVLNGINEGLMSLFFLVIGLELKRECCVGKLSGRAGVILPGIAALGGMIVPALVYAIINYAHPIAIKGWATPVATDIAFALGVLSLLGQRVPLSLKLFLMALAIFDDVGAIFIIAFFHTQTLSFIFLFFACLVMIGLYALNYFGVKHLAFYVLLGLLLWWCIFYSGIHPTIAGVLLALTIPLKETHSEKQAPLYRLESRLHPWVAYGVMPLFAFANAGLSFHGLFLSALFEKVTLGIILGLCIGKPLGVLSFTWIATRLKWATLPIGTTWLQLSGMAILCGIGFTMSLLLGMLAFQQEHVSYLSQVKLGVLVGSLLSGVAGAMLLLKIKKKI